MWEEIYRVFTKDNLDENYWLQLAEKIDTLNHMSSLDSINQRELEQRLNHIKVILIHYGLNQKELEENLKIIVKGVLDYLRQFKGSGKIELYFDITHSFRSLSLYSFLVIMLLKNLSHEINFEIKGIYYGMLDIKKKFETSGKDYVPIVELSYLNKAIDFIIASYSFQNFGNGFLLAKMVKNFDKKLGQNILELSKAVSMNYSQAIIQSMQNIKGQKIPEPYSYFIPSDLYTTSQKLDQNTKARHLQELELATWHYKNKNYSNAYILLAEAIVTYECKRNGLDPGNKNDRDAAKESLSNPSNDLGKISKEISDIRNRTAHNIPTGDLEKDFKELGKYIARVKQLISN